MTDVVDDSGWRWRDFAACKGLSTEFWFPTVNAGADKKTREWDQKDPKNPEHFAQWQEWRLEVSHDTRHDTSWKGWLRWLAKQAGQDHAAEVRAAIRICQNCEVRTECLTFAVEYGETHGIWGGLLAAQRERLNQAHVNKYGKRQRSWGPAVTPPPVEPSRQVRCDCGEFIYLRGLPMHQTRCGSDRYEEIAS